MDGYSRIHESGNVLSLGWEAGFGTGAGLLGLRLGFVSLVSWRAGCCRQGWSRDSPVSPWKRMEPQAVLGCWGVAHPHRAGEQIHGAETRRSPPDKRRDKSQRKTSSPGKTAPGAVGVGRGSRACCPLCVPGAGIAAGAGTCGRWMGGSPGTPAAPELSLHLSPRRAAAACVRSIIPCLSCRAPKAFSRKMLGSAGSSTRGSCVEFSLLPFSMQGLGKDLLPVHTAGPWVGEPVPEAGRSWEEEFGMFGGGMSCWE